VRRRNNEGKVHLTVFGRATYPVFVDGAQIWTDMRPDPVHSLRPLDLFYPRTSHLISPLKNQGRSVLNCMYYLEMVFGRESEEEKPVLIAYTSD